MSETSASDKSLRQTVLYSRHVALGAKIVEFGGWAMPVQYPGGILQEHLLTRRSAGLFDVSHMGRLVFRGRGCLGFLQHVLTNDAAALAVGTSQYTMIPNAAGGAIDDAYLYRFVENEYLLVVNAANLDKDRACLLSLAASCGDVDMLDRSDELAMISLQGPQSEDILHGLIEGGTLPPPRRNACCIVRILGQAVPLARTGYTGEPLCFELMPPRDLAGQIWDLLLARGASPVGLGARDTLRLEAALPLYGHELGSDCDGREIPIFACPLARFAVSFSPAKGDFIGRRALLRQHDAWQALQAGGASRQADLPRRIVPLAVLGKGVARAGTKIFRGVQGVGSVTSGTMVPYWTAPGGGASPSPASGSSLRAIALALVDSRLGPSDPLEVDIRGARVAARIVKRHLDSSTPPFARPVVLPPLDA